MKFLKDNTVVNIREATPDDAQELINLFKKIGSKTSFLLMDHLGLDISVEKEKEYLSKANGEITTKYFIAIINNKIVGNCGIKGHDNYKTKHNVNLSIAILNEYSNKGLGKLLLEHTINYARITQEVKNIFLEVREDNIYAIKLYENIGFVKCGSMPNKVFENGKYYSELIYVLQI